jgi:hypothetical protein
MRPSAISNRKSSPKLRKEQLDAIVWATDSVIK